MIITLNFTGEGKATVDIMAQTDAEKSILAYLAEGAEKHWMVYSRYTYRAGGIERVQLVEQIEQPPTEHP